MIESNEAQLQTSISFSKKKILTTQNNIEQCHQDIYLVWMGSSSP